jgi:hypothetical protein
LLEIAEICGANYRTVRNILMTQPDANTVAQELPTKDDRFVLVTESGLHHDDDSLTLYPEMAQPWVQGAALEDSTPIKLRRRMSLMGDRFGWIRIAKLVYVDPITLKEIQQKI